LTAVAVQHTTVQYIKDTDKSYKPPPENSAKIYKSQLP